MPEIQMDHAPGMHCIQCAIEAVGEFRRHLSLKLAAHTPARPVLDGKGQGIDPPPEGRHARMAVQHLPRPRLPTRHPGAQGPSHERGARSEILHDELGAGNLDAVDIGVSSPTAIEQLAR